MPIDKSDKESHSEEHYRALEPEQKVSYGKRSDQQEGTSQAEPHSQSPTVKTNQEVSVKSTKRAEVKPDVEKKRNGDTDGELIPINVDPVSKDTEIKDNAGDDDKESASGPDISNHVKKIVAY